MKFFFKTIFILLLFQACSPWRKNIKSNGNYTDVISNAIIDFSHTTSLVKNDKTFEITIDSLNNELIFVSLSGTISKFIITTEAKNSRLPTNYLEYNGKLFYWYDKRLLNENIVNKLNEYDLIDSVATIADAEFIRDDGKKGADYYFCKNNLSIYKKVITNKARGDYKSPTLHCNVKKKLNNTDL